MRRPGRHPRLRPRPASCGVLLGWVLEARYSLAPCLTWVIEASEMILWESRGVAVEERVVRAERGQ